MMMSSHTPKLLQQFNKDQRILATLMIQILDFWDLR